MSYRLRLLSVFKDNESMMISKAVIFGELIFTFNWLSSDLILPIILVPGATDISG